MTPPDERRVALVTGAGRGIGQQVCVRLAKTGYLVIAADRKAELAGDTQALLGRDVCTAVELDVTDRESVRAAVADVLRDHGRLDLLVNNAMWLRYLPLAEVEPKAFDRMIDVGVKAPLWTVQACADALAESGGAVVNIASLAAYRGTPNAAVYSAVKGAVVAMTAQLAFDLGPRGVRVNAIAPGTVLTEGSAAAMSDGDREYRISRAPLRRLGRPDDIAEAVVFLGGPGSDYVTGQVLKIDGGISVAM